MFNAAKDAFSSQAARSYVNGLIKRYGEVRDLKIDSRAKSLDVICALKGEVEPVRVRVDRYRIESHGTERFIHFEACSASRLWLQNLLEDHLTGKRVPLPAWAAAAL